MFLNENSGKNTRTEFEEIIFFYFKMAHKALLIVQFWSGFFGLELRHKKILIEIFGTKKFHRKKEFFFQNRYFQREKFN